MYQLVVTNDFIDILKDLPLKYISVLSSSFVSIKKLPDENSLETDRYAFLNDLLSQIKNQELE